MTKLEYTFKTDTLFKMLFVKYPDLLKRLVAELLSIKYDSIEQFIITNPSCPGQSPLIYLRSNCSIARSSIPNSKPWKSHAIHS